MTEHHAYGASPLSRRAACSPSASLEETFPPLPPSPTAEEGTAIHSEISAHLKWWLWRQGPSPSEVDDLSHDAREALGYVEAEIDRRENLPVSLVEQTIALDEATLQLAVPSAPRGYFEALAGVLSTPDLVLIWPDGQTLVVDWKTGWGDPEPMGLSLQLMAYGVLAWVDSHRSASSYYVDPAHVEGVTFHTKSGKLSRLYFDPRAGLERWRQIVESADPEADPVAGPHCRWCHALGLCSATQREMRDLLELTGGEHLLATQARERNKQLKLIVDGLPREKFVEALRWVPLVKAACSALEGRARSLEELSPGASGLYQLVETAGSRWAPPEELIALLVREGVQKDAILERLKLSVSEAEKLWLAEHAQDYPTKIAAKRAFEERTRSIVSQQTTTRLERRSQ